ncbi:unnamed protein product [Hymenolepis diminuta]|uniref:MARVEL domain-containing protein n=1 Tax=Hymenolepis diminuta TaxID=6216 RepID=A0A0R3SGG2_HYMDI|nr:unnamed protein product [Hymenolepis diminuta]VUZ46367.1 unnamed protein product [Hymenolepis diminuta]
MDRKIGYLIISIIATILFMVAIGYAGWGCGGSILSQRCIKLSKIYEITGALLLTAGLLVFIAGVFILLYMLKGFGWSNIIATVACFIAAILALAAMFYYYDSGNIWSPFIATIAMSLNVALAGMLVFEIVGSNK